MQNCTGAPEPTCDLGTPRFSPDGSRIAFSKIFIAYPPGQAFQYQSGLGFIAANGSQFEFHPTVSVQSVLAWSPAGNQLLLQDGAAPFTVSIASLDGTALRQLAPPGLEVVPRAADWASTGQIAFEARPAGAMCPPACSGDIYAMAVGGMARRVTFRGGESPSWSPHASKLAFVRRARPDQQGDIYVVRKSGRGLRRLTRRGGEAPAWSPDGKRIAFIRDGDLYVIRTDGTRKRRLVDEQPDGYGGALQPPDWQPRPRR